MSGGSGFESSCGSVGIWPVTKHQPSTSTAWLNGATGVGAPGAMKNSGALIHFLPIDWRAARAMPRRSTRTEQELLELARSERLGNLRCGDVEQEGGEQPDLDR